MDKLSNLTLLIGRDPGVDRLLISIKVNGQSKKIAVSENVPNSVSRCEPINDRAHCKIDIASDGSMLITNLKPQNITYVNGSPIATKKITASSNVELGKDRYHLNISDILAKVSKVLEVKPGEDSVQLSIKHLEKVWLDYEAEMEAISRRQMDKGKKRLLPMIMTSLSSLLVPILGFALPGDAGKQSVFVTLPVAALCLMFWLKTYFEKDTSLDDKKTVQDKFIDEYVCPACSCHHFLGYTPYKILKQNKKCPYCGVKWTDK